MFSAISYLSSGDDSSHEPATKKDIIVDIAISALLAGGLVYTFYNWTSASPDRIQQPEPAASRPVNPPRRKRLTRRQTLMEESLNKSSSTDNVAAIVAKRKNINYDFETCENAIMSNNLKALKAALTPRLTTFVHQEGYNLLHIAAGQGNTAACEVLLDRGSGVDSIGSNGLSPLHVAACAGFGETVGLLLSKGADYELKTEDGLTPMLLAASSGFSECIKALALAGADVNCKAPDMRTPLHFASRGYPINESGNHTLAVETLLEYGADSQMVDKRGALSLHRAAFAGHLKSVKALYLNYQDGLNKGNEDGQTPLYLAAAGEHADIVEYLLAQGADQRKDLEGYTPLHAAAETGCLEIARKLLDQGAAVDEETNDGATPLYNAAFAGEDSMVSFLIKQGANPLKKGPGEKTPAEVARDNGYPKIARTIAAAVCLHQLQKR